MQRNWLRLFVYGVIFFFLTLVGGVVLYWLTSQPLFRAPVVQTEPVRWNALPTPTLTNPAWTSYTSSQKINALLELDGLLWVGTDGGLVVQSLQSSDQKHFLSEHGLGGNRVSALAAGADRSIWVGSVAGGVSHFDGHSWQIYTANDGLSSNAVRDLAVTADGAVWAATDRGLNRFDGRRWTQYNAINTLFGLSTLETRAVAAVPNSNRLWVATDEGLAFFDGRRWSQYSLTGGNLGSDNVFDVDVASSGVVWVAHQAGVQRLENGRWSQYGQSDGLLSPEIAWVTARAANEATFGYRDPALPVANIRIDSGFVSVTHFEAVADLPQNVSKNGMIAGSDALYLATDEGLFTQGEAGWEKRPLPGTLPSHDVTDLVAGRGTVWAAGEFGVGRFDGSAWQIFTEADGLESRSVTQLAIGPNETPYAAFGVAGMGLSRFRSSGQWEPIGCPIRAPQSLQIYDGFEASDGGYWFASNRGVANFDQSEWQIFTPFHGLPDGRIWDIDQGPDGTIWAATQFGFTYFDGGRWRIIPVENAQQIAVSPAGDVWGLSVEEVFRIDNGTATAVSLIPAQQIGSIDATSEALWIATANGVARLDSATLTWFTYTVGEGLPFNRTPVVFVDELEQVWALSESGTLQPPNGYYIPFNFNLRYVSKLVGQRWQPTLIADGDRPIHGIVTKIKEAPNGDIWVATLAGVSRFDGERWTSFTVANGIPAPEIFGLAYAYDSIWVATQNGVVQLVPHGERGWVATNRLGWNGEAFLRIQLETAPDGTVWASDGVTLYQFAGSAWETFPVTDPNGTVRLDSMAFDKNGRLWAAAFISGEDAQRSQQLYLGVHDGDETWVWQPVQTQSGIQPNSFQGLRFAPDGRLWGYSSNGVWVFDVAQNNFGQAVAHYGAPLAQVSDIAFTDEGTPLLTHRMDNDLWQIEAGQPSPIPLPIFESSGAHAVTVATDGAVWIGTNHGVAELRNSGWRTHPAPALQPEGTSNALTVVDEGHYWIGTFEGQVIEYSDGEVKELPRYTDSRSDERPYPITGIFPREKNDVWVSSLAGGVSRFDGVTWQQLGSSESLYDGVVQTLTFSGNTAWIGTSDGLVRRDVTSSEPCQKIPNLLWEDTRLAVTGRDETLWFLGGQVVYAFQDEEFRRGGYQALPAAATAVDGSVWFATVEGLVRQGDGRMRQLITELPTDTAVRTLAIDGNDTLWLGASDGVHIFTQAQWQQWTSANGLADNVVTAIAFAPDGAIWFATEGGLSRYVP